MPKIESTVEVTLPLPKIGQKVRVVKPFNTCFVINHVAETCPLPVGATGTVTEAKVDDDGSSAFIGIRMDIDTDEMKDWAEGYQESVGGEVNENTVYLYDGTAFTHNGVELTAVYEFHLHFEYVE